MMICASQFDALLEHLGSEEGTGCSIIPQDESCQVERTKWNCDIDILEYLIDTFMCMFPEPECYCPCHTVDDFPCAHCYQASCCTACSNFPYEGFWDHQTRTEAAEERTTSFPTTTEYNISDDEEDNITVAS